MKQKISIADKRIIERIMTVKDWNKDARPDEKINVKYGYVMPLFHGYEWKRTKMELIRKYTYAQ